MIKKNLILLTILFLIPNLALAKSEYFQEGIELFNKNKFDDAKFKFEQDIVFNPKNESSYLFLAKIYNLKKNDSQEEKNLNTVILLNPKNEEAVLNLTLLKIRKSNYKETKKLIKNFKNICKKLCQQTFNLQNKLDSVLKK